LHSRSAKLGAALVVVATAFEAALAQGSTESNLGSFVRRAKVGKDENEVHQFKLIVARRTKYEKHQVMVLLATLVEMARFIGCVGEIATIRAARSNLQNRMQPRYHPGYRFSLACKNCLEFQCDEPCDCRCPMDVGDNTGYNCWVAV
jgi:hypothetical protein